jgi:hypothetical protein
MSGLGQVPSVLGEAPLGHSWVSARAKGVLGVESRPVAAARRMEAKGSLMVVL